MGRELLVGKWFLGLESELWVGKWISCKANVIRSNYMTPHN